MNWHNYSKLIPAGSHAIFSGSNYHWVDYDTDKAINYIKSAKAKETGTKLHAFAEEAIKLGVSLQGKGTLARYVNDAIKLGMDTEILLYFSPYFFGYADAICVDHKGKLRIHDLKTGVTPASMKQLYIYDAFYCLDYMVNPFDIPHELRIYQNDEVFVDTPDPNEIKIIMTKIQDLNTIFNGLKERGELL